jgi:hypothetical protein
VERSNTATGGDTLPISNETLRRTENCLPSSNSDNDVSLAAHGNTAISHIKKRVTPRCKWTDGCSRYVQSNPKRFCSKHYSSWLLIQAGGGGEPAINNDTISCGGEAGGGGAPTINNNTINCGEQAMDGRNNDTISHGEEAGGNGEPAINNYTIGCGEEAGGGGAKSINNDTVSRGEQSNNSNYYQQLIKLQSEEIKELNRKLYEQQQLQSRDYKIRILESNV